MAMRCASRILRLGEREFATPLTVPSFSSRAKPPTPLPEFFEETLGEIVGPILVSAYDVAHPPPDATINVVTAMKEAAPSFVLLDSGGYEAIWNERAERAGLIRSGSAPSWSRDEHFAVLDRWPTDIPLLAVTFDTPNDRISSLDEQIDRAEELAARYPHHSIELLLKPTGERFDLAALAKAAPRLLQFPVVGVTEDEIGGSMAERLQFLSEFRRILDGSKLNIPVHVFGGLDPLMTPLYFAAGADIFDGLTWLRYAFSDNIGIYDKSYIATEFPHKAEKDQIWNMRLRNIRTLVDLQVALSRFLQSGDFGEFGTSSERLSRAWDKCGVIA